MFCTNRIPISGHKIPHQRQAHSTMSRLRGDVLGQEGGNLLWPSSSRENHNLSDRERITVDSLLLNSIKDTQKVLLPGYFLNANLL